MINFLIIFSTLFIFSCGKSIEDRTGDEEQEINELDGRYRAVLIPINGRVSSQLYGDVTISKYGDEFKVSVHLANAPSGIHKQYLHTGSNCPKMVNDDNRDGYVDMYESRESMGHALIPFDDDLSSQMGGHNFPSGSYRYSKSTSYDLMLSDLHLTDEVSNDLIVKLRERDVVLERRVVGIYGRNRQMPASVAGAEVPIACGILTKISGSELPDGGGYERNPSPPDDNRRPRPRPRPRPQPEPEPEPEPEIENPEDGSWWDRLRSRWRRWRDRWRSDGEGEL